MMSTIIFKCQSLKYFDEFYVYGDYALVNEIYEDDDVRKNTWMWGKVFEDCVMDAKLLDGLSSNSYAPIKEVFDRFKEIVEKET